MMHVGKYTVVVTQMSRHVPPHHCSVCLVNSLAEAKEYLEKEFKELLEWDKEDFGEGNIVSFHSDDWRYARIQALDPYLRRDFYVSDIVHDTK